MSCSVAGMKCPRNRRGVNRRPQILPAGESRVHQKPTVLIDPNEVVTEIFQIFLIFSLKFCIHKHKQMLSGWLSGPV